MALNSAQTNVSQVKTLGQLMNVMGKSITNYVKNDDAMIAIMMMCVVLVILSVAMNDVVMIAVSGGVFMLALIPMLYRWSKLPEEK